MDNALLPQIFTIRDVFEQEIASVGGTATDVFDDGQRLFMRSVMPRSTEIRVGDTVRGGVALRASQRVITVAPYTFRLVCSNGAIMAHAVESRRVSRVDADIFADEEQVIEALREAIRCSSSDESFESASGSMRAAVDASFNMGMQMMAILNRLPGAMSSAVAKQIVERLFEEPDRSAYSFMNAITAQARDTRDPDAKWELEELGGAVLAETRPRSKVRRATLAV